MAYTTDISVAGSGSPDIPDPSDQKKVEDILETVGLHPAQLHVQSVLNGTPTSSPAPAPSPDADFSQQVRTLGLNGWPTRPSGLVSPGNIDLYHRPSVPNPEHPGQMSTVYSAGVGTDRGEMLIPRVITPPGQEPHVASVPDAIDEAKRSKQNLGIFDTSANADKYAQDLHNMQASGAMGTYRPIDLGAPAVRIPSPIATAAPPGMSSSTPSSTPLIRAPQQQNAEDSTVAAQNELARLTRTGSGISQIKNPFLRGLARVGDIAGSALFPAVAMNVPGTELHHDLLENQQEHKIAEGEGQQEKLAQVEEQEARAQELAHPKPQLEMTDQGLVRVPQEGEAAPVTMGGAPLKKAEPEKLENMQQLYAQAVQDAVGRGVKPEDDPKVQQYADAITSLQKTTGTKTKEQLQAEIAADYEKGDKESLAKHQAELQALDPNAAQRLQISVQNAGAGAGNRSDARSDKSFQYNNSALDKAATPVDQAVQRLGRLQDTLAQGTPQADALVAPELLSVMSGGQGSGLRMNEAEISRIVGGRSAWENLKASMQHWSTDPNAARSITPDQQQQIRTLVDAVHSKLLQKQKFIDDAREALIDTDDPKEHRRIVADTKQKLDQVDSSSGGNPGNGGMGPKVGDVVDGYRFKGGNYKDQKNWEAVKQ